MIIANKAETCVRSVSMSTVCGSAHVRDAVSHIGARVDLYMCTWCAQLEFRPSSCSLLD